MAYLGSTAPKATANPPVKLTDSIMGGVAIWSYKSTHSSTDTKTAGFFTDAKNLGMQAGDLMLQVNSGTTKAYFGIVGAISTANGSAALASAASSTSA